MTIDSQDDRVRKFAFFVLGIALPIVGWLFWTKTGGFSLATKKTETDRAHDVTVEDSFPASDPPSAW